MPHNTVLMQRLDDDAAELNLLEGFIGDLDGKAGQLVSILDAFDGRFKNLENSIDRIHNSTEKYTRVAENIDSTLKLTTEISERLKIPSKEEGFITKGPSENDILPYLRAIDQLKEVVAANSASNLKPCQDAVHRTMQLLKAGMLHLEKLFREWLESVSKPIDETAILLPNDNLHYAHFAPPSEKTTKQLADLCTYFTTSEKEVDYTADVRKAYIKIRGEYLETSLRPFSKENITSERGGMYDKGSSKFLPYMECFTRLLQLERNFVFRVFESETFRRDVLKGSIKDARGAFVNAGQRLNNYARQYGYKDAYFVLDILEKYRNDFEPSFNDNDDLDLEEVHNMMAAFKKTAFKCFHDFMENLKSKGDSSSATGMSKDAPKDGTVYEMTSQTLNHLKHLCHWRDVVQALLIQLGDNGWRNPDSAAGQLKKPLEYGDSALGNSLFQKFFTAALDQLAESLESKALLDKNLNKKPDLTAVFLLNNYNHILHQIETIPLDNVFDRHTKEKFRNLVKDQIDRYHNLWKPCVMHLIVVTIVSGGTIKNADRQATKDSFKNFNQEFEAMWNDQTKYAIPDNELRNRIIREVKDVLVPMYGTFLEKHKGNDFTKNRDKYIKYENKRELERKIDHLFEPTA